MMIAASNAMCAQIVCGFVPFVVEQEFNENGFSWFCHALLLATCDEQQSSSMTIGWGDIDTLWLKTAALGLHTEYIGEMVNVWKKEP